MRSLAVLLTLAFGALAPVASAQQDDWGFDDEETWESSPADEPDVAPEDESFLRLFDLTGDVSLGSSYNYLHHHSATGTGYGNLSRLRAQLDLQLDVDLPAGWQTRVSGYGFYDFAYVARGRSRYTDDVLDDYEWEVEFREVWIQGSPLSSLDVKLGRQVVNWGRSDTLRVLDVLNPLDNREPGLVDIEDLRLPVTMARVDWYPSWIPREYGQWSLQLLVIPEFRQDRNPSIGNDFNPTPFEIDPPSDKPDQFFDSPEYGVQIKGTFSGWDVSVYGARIYANQPLVVSALGGVLQRHPLVTMVGAGGNYTLESWLFKGEIAWFDQLEYTSFEPVDVRVVDKSRLDAMGGVEYYGINDFQVALEVVHRHIFRYDPAMKAEFMGVEIAYAEEDVTEAALRLTWNLMNERLSLTGVGFVLVGNAEDHLGSVLRFEADYELMDALSLGGGIVLYQEGDSPALGDVGKNDRLFLRIEYAF